ncbi:MAG: dihydropteroate synthase [Eubacterium sp.]
MIWNCRDKKIEYGAGKVLIMGIVNVTPDSFSDGGNYFLPEDAVAHAMELVTDGADIIDLGAQSTRPGYQEISPDEEWGRLEPVITQLRNKTDLPISVDTYFSSVAKRCIDAGADIINDVSGIINPDMAQAVADSGCGWVIMHNGDGGCPQVKEFFEHSVKECRNLGIDSSQICLDMGIGFGKTVEQNIDLIANIPQYRLGGYPVLLGCSKKRVIGALSGQQQASQRVYGNIAADTVAVLGGVDIIRLHDVKNERQGILTAQELAKWIR